MPSRPPPPPPPARRGRPRSDSVPALRAERLAVYLIKRDHPEITNKALALCRNVTIRTIRHWRRCAELYSEVLDAQA
jgi:hypothetical protein